MLDRSRSLAAVGTLAVVALAACAGLAGAEPAAAATAYSPPSHAWSQFTSDLSGASGLATGQGVTVALLSDGADTSSPGLGGKVTTGPDYVYRPRVSLAHSGATVEASLILGVPSVAQGVAPAARILSERVEPTFGEPGVSQFFATPSYDSSEQAILARAIRYAADHGATVIDAEIEVTSFALVDDSALLSAVDYALSKNVVIVGEAWGEGATAQAYVYPGGLPGVIGVSSVMLPGGMSPSQLPPASTSGLPPRADMSARNNSVVIAGPGDFVPALPDTWGPYGVSTAVAYVTGTVALIKQRYPDLAPSLVERALAMSARDHPGGGYSKQVGFGVLDPYDAILDAGKLAKVTVAAGPGDTVTDGGAHFGAGPLPGDVSALPPDTAEVIASCSGIVAGAVLIVIAVVLAVRRRNRARLGQLEQPAARRAA